MAKKRARRRKNSFTIPVALAIPIGTLGYDLYKDSMDQGFGEALRWLGGKLTGYYAQANYPDWRIKHMKHGALPLAVGYGVHWIAGKMGVNRAIARAGLPIIRI